MTSKKLRSSLVMSCVLGLLISGSAHAQQQPIANWSVALDPGSAQASSVHWTFALSAPYCGGYRIGDGVHIQLLAPFALPDSVPPDGVVFAGQAAQVSLDNGVLVVGPAPGLAQSMICMAGDSAFTVELLPSVGLVNPDSGSYLVDVWLGTDSTPTELAVSVDMQPNQ